MQPKEHYRLTIRQGATPGKEFELSREVMIIGRDLKCEIVINDPEISRNHTRLTAQAEGYLVEDLNSTNGSFVNSQRVTDPKIMHPGDLLGLGENIVLEYSLSDAAAATVVMQQAMVDPALAAAAAYTPPPTPLPEQPAMAASVPDPFTPSQPAWSPSPAPMATTAPLAPPTEKKSNRNVIIIVAVVVAVLLCCCCLAIIVVVVLMQQGAIPNLFGSQFWPAVQYLV